MKRETRWTGYKVHLTETCDEEGPNLITNVETTTAAVADDAVTKRIHAGLPKQTEDYRAEYARRAGVEGTIAQAVRSHAMRRARYFGLPKTHLQHLMAAAAINVVRILRWLAGEPKAVTQVSAFASLYQPVT